MRNLGFSFIAFLLGIMFLFGSFDDFRYLISIGPSEDLKRFVVICSRMVLGVFFISFHFIGFEYL